MTEEKRKDDIPPDFWASVKTELKAVCALESYLLKSDVLLPLICRNDRDLSWDGKVNVFSDVRMRKSDFVGSVNIQVKGSRRQKFPDDRDCQFRIDVADLRNYRNCGGAIFFNVCFVGEDEFRIYFTCLFPSKIDRELKRTPGRKTKTLKLERYPDDPKLQEKIIQYFLENSRRQVGFYSPSSTAPNVEKILRSGDFQLMFTRLGRANDSSDSPLWAPDALCYVIGKDSVPIPCDVVVTETTQHRQERVMVGDRAFFYGFAQKRTATKKTEIFGAGMLTRDGERFKARLNGPLAASIQASRFLIAALETGGFRIEDYEEIELIDDNLTQTLPRLRTLLKAREVLAETFEKFGLDADAELSRFSEQDRVAAELLVEAAKGPVRRDEFQNDLDALFERGAAFCVDLDVGAETILLSVKEAEKPGYYVVENFFKASPVLTLTFENGETRETTAFIALTKEELANIANIDFSEILSAVERLDAPEIAGNIDELFRNMLLAFDECEKLGRKKRAAELLNAAERLNAWTLDRDEENVVARFRRLQILKRRGELSDAEKGEALTLAERTNDERFRLVASVLLDEKTRAQMYWRNLALADQRAFWELPIARFIDKEDFPLTARTGET